MTTNRFYANEAQRLRVRVDELVADLRHVRAVLRELVESEEAFRDSPIRSEEMEQALTRLAEAHAVRNLNTLDRYRHRSRLVVELFGSFGDATCGVFVVPSPIDGADMRAIASCGGGWEHVSVARPNRCPNWPELEHVKRLFFAADECAMQLHVPVAEHVNAHPYCLHLWRPIRDEIPRPPAWMVAPP